MKKILFFALPLLLIIVFTAGKEPSQSPLTFDPEVEKKAIMATIQQETECFYLRDYNCWKDNYVQADYAFQAWNNANGTYDASVGWSAVDERIGKFIRENPVPNGGSSHPKVDRRNLTVKFYGETVAHLIWDQYNSDREMKNYTISKEVRLMEKQNGKWKIVSVSAFWDYTKKVPME